MKVLSFSSFSWEKLFLKQNLLVELNFHIQTIQQVCIYSYSHLSLSLPLLHLYSHSHSLKIFNILQRQRSPTLILVSELINDPLCVLRR